MVWKSGASVYVYSYDLVDPPTFYHTVWSVLSANETVPVKRDVTSVVIDQMVTSDHLELGAR